MHAFLEFVIKALAEHPDEATVTTVERHGLTLFEVRLHPKDIGRMIGRQGQTINAIRSLLAAAGARKGQRCTLELVENRAAA